MREHDNELPDKKIERFKKMFEKRLKFPLIE